MKNSKNSLKLFLLSLFTISLLTFAACEKPDENEDEDTDNEEETQDENEDATEDEEANEDNEDADDEEDIDEDNSTSGNGDFENAEIVDGQYTDPEGRFTVESELLENLSLIYGSEYSVSFSNDSSITEPDYLTVYFAGLDNFGIYDSAQEITETNKEIDFDVYEEFEIVTDVTEVTSKDGTPGSYYVASTTDFGDFTYYMLSSSFLKDDIEYTIDIEAGEEMWETNSDQFVQLLESLEIQ